MNSLIDPTIVESIRETGNAVRDLPSRTEILEKYDLPFDRTAENVVITGCMVLSAVPHVLRALASIFEKKGVRYTFLSKEYCCGNYLYRPAIKERDEEALAQCRELSREFIAGNIRQARTLGATRIVIFCSPCYPIYKLAFPQEDIVFYPRAIHEATGKLAFEGRIDYYAGCYRLHRRLSSVPMDLQSTEEIFSNITGLDVHRIGAPQCCFSPEGLSHMIGGVETDTMVHVCTGCYLRAVENMPKDRGTRVLMLPEFVESISH